MANYYCEQCGIKSSSVSSLTGGTCPRHPNGAYKGKPNCTKAQKNLNTIVSIVALTTLQYQVSQAELVRDIPMVHIKENTVRRCREYKRSSISKYGNIIEVASLYNFDNVSLNVNRYYCIY